MYGKSRFTKGRSSNRASGATRMRASTAYKKVGNSFSKSRSVVGQRLARREIKYDDDYYSLQSWSKFYAAATTNNSGLCNWVLGGILRRSNVAGGMVVNWSGGGGAVPMDTYAPNCLTNIDSGTTAKTRIGNVVQPRYLNVRGVLNAAMTNDPKDGETTFRDETGAEPITLVQRYLRTSVRVIVLRDKSMNEKGYVAFQDVFEDPSGTGGGAANNPFLWNRKVDTISRYQILKTVDFELDQDDPQACFNWTIPLNGIAIRFNGASSRTLVEVPGRTPLLQANGAPVVGSETTHVTAESADAQSMTNGIYLLAVAHNGLHENATAGAAAYISPSMVFSSRLTFED